jgi:hypothetical protein
MDERLEYIVGGTSACSFDAFLDQNKKYGSYFRYISELFISDPIMQLIKDYRRVTSIKTYNLRQIDRPNRALRVFTRNPILVGLSLLHQGFGRTGQKEVRQTFPSWNSRRSLNLYGETQFLGKVPKSVSQLYNFALPGGFNDEMLYLSRFVSGSTIDHCTFDDLRYLAKRMFPYVGSTFKRTQSLNRSGTHILESLFVGNSEIRYSLRNPKYVAYPNSNSIQAAHLDVRILRRSVDFPGSGITILVEGLEGIIINNNPSLSSPAFYGEAVEVRNVVQQDDIATLLGLRSRIRNSIGAVTLMQLRPALYHTCASGLNKVLISFSHNFENLIELPQFLSVMSSLSGLSSGSHLRKYFGDLSSPLDKILGFAKLLSGSILAWNYAVKPTLDSLVGLTKDLVLPEKGESSMIFEGSDLSSLPSGLKDLVLKIFEDFGISSSLLLEYEIVFRSEVMSAPSYRTFGRALYEHNPLFRIGALPSPKAIWDVAKFSFIVDWFLPIGRLIQDAQSYLLAPTIPLSIGHTARFRITINDGQVLDLFLRSRPSAYPVDPQEDSWLQSSGVSWTSIPLAIQNIVSPLIQK